MWGCYRFCGVAVVGGMLSVVVARCGVVVAFGVGVGVVAVFFVIGVLVVVVCALTASHSFPPP